jgi:hypothetical protein
MDQKDLLKKIDLVVKESTLVGDVDMTPTSNTVPMARRQEKKKRKGLLGQDKED